MSSDGTVRFSASDAALEGFQVLRRHWRVVAGWAGFNLMAMIAMVIVTVIVTLVTAAVTGSGLSSPSAVSGILGGLVAGVGGLLVEIVLMAGLYRLMLRPEEPGFLHLRLGRDEFRLLGLIVILGIGVGLLVLASLEASRLVRPLGSPAAIAVAVLAALAGIWLALRFMLTGPATFDGRRITLRTSWRLTRGHAGALLGMMALLICIVGLIAAVFWLVLFVGLGLLGGFGNLFASLSGRDTASPGLYLLQVAAELGLAPVLGVIGHAPAVAAYRALSSPAAETP